MLNSMINPSLKERESYKLINLILFHLNGKIGRLKNPSANSGQQNICFTNYPFDSKHKRDEIL